MFVVALVLWIVTIVRRKFFITDPPQTDANTDLEE